MPETVMTQEALQEYLSKAMAHIDHTASELKSHVYQVDKDLKKIFIADNASQLLSKLLENLNSFSFMLFDTQQQLLAIEQRTRYPLIHIQHHLEQIEGIAKRVATLENKTTDLGKQFFDLQLLANNKISRDALEQIVARIVDEKLAATQRKA